MTRRYRRPEALETLQRDGRPARHAVVEASAGTGKTFLIEHAVAELILTGCPIEELLVVTFTEKAAKELRLRIRELLEAMLLGQDDCEPDEPHWRIEGEAITRLQTALLAFDRAPIQTIHAFCRRVLTDNAFLAGRLFRQELVDEKTAFQEALTTAFRCPIPTNKDLASELEAWLRSSSLEKLQTLLTDVARTRARIVPAIDLEETGRVASEFSAWIKANASVLNRSAEAISNGSKKNAVKRRLRELAPLSAPDAGSARLDVLCGLSGLDDYLFVNESHVLPHQGFPELLAHLREIQSKLGTYEAVAAQLFLPVVQEVLAEQKAAAGLFDFHDMLALVDRALRKSPRRATLLRRLREQFRFALIDEFQDTDEIQWRIFRTIFVDGTKEHGLWVVGDPKQSIYGFRGADVFAWFEATEFLESKGAPRHPLQRNFRSTPDMIRAHHRFFETDPSFFGEHIDYDPEVESGVPETRLVDRNGQAVSPVEVTRLLPDRGGKFYADRIREAEARLVTAEIGRILDGSLLYGERTPEPIAPQDIFVLTRNRFESKLVGDTLREARIPYAFFKQDGLFQTTEADDVARVLAAVDQPWSWTARAKAWTTPFFAVPLADIESCRELPGDHPLMAQLLRWHRLAEDRRFETLFASIVEDSGLVRRELVLSRSERELTNILHIFERLLEELGRGRKTLRELVQQLRSWIDEDSRPEGDDGNVQRLESDSNAVQIMTMHKAKGLQATVVFVVGGLIKPKQQDVNLFHKPGEPRAEDERSGRPPREDDPLTVTVFHDGDGERVVHVGSMDSATRRCVEAERRDEDRRLVYVAMTRARARLYLFTFPKNAKGDWDIWGFGATARPIAERLEALDGQVPSSLYRYNEVAVDGVDAPRTPQRRGAVDISDLDLSDSDPHRKTCEALRESKDHRARVVTSYSRLADRSGADEKFAIEAEELREVLAEEEESGERLPGGRRFGVLVHEILEHLDPATAGDEGELDSWRSQGQVTRVVEPIVKRFGADDTERAYAEQLVHQCLRTPLDFPGLVMPEGLSRCGQRSAEAEFLFPAPDPGGARFGENVTTVERGWVRGVIDLLFEHDGRIFLLDWKTDRLPRYDAERLKQRVAAHYAMQSRLYSLALVRMLGVRDEAAFEQRFGGSVYAFLRGMEPAKGPNAGLIFHRPTWAEIEAMERDLTTLELA